MSCIFCEIVKGNIPAYKVWEDERVLAFLDIQPINQGHVLVIPKTHEPYLEKLDDATYQNVMMVVKKVSEKITEKIQPKRVGLAVMGWDVPHAHVHVVPMNDAQDITSKKILEGTLLHPTPQEFEEMKNKFTN